MLRIARWTAVLVVVATLNSVSGVAAEPVEHIVEITGFKFVPEAIDVSAGDKITWINRDIAPHTASSDDDSWDTGTLKQNESKSLVVSSNMSSGYYCRFHPGMTASVSVGD